MQALNTRVAELEQQSAASEEPAQARRNRTSKAARKALDRTAVCQVNRQTADSHCRRPAGAAQARMGDIRRATKKPLHLRRPGTTARRSSPGAGAAVQRGRPGTAAAASVPLSIAAPGGSRRCADCDCCASVPSAPGNYRSSGARRRVPRWTGQTQRIRAGKNPMKPSRSVFRHPPLSSRCCLGAVGASLRPSHGSPLGSEQRHLRRAGRAPGA